MAKTTTTTTPTPPPESAHDVPRQVHSFSFYVSPYALVGKPTDDLNALGFTGLPDDIRLTLRWIDTQQRWLFADYYERHVMDIFRAIRNCKSNRGTSAYTCVELWTSPKVPISNCDDVDGLEWERYGDGKEKNKVSKDALSGLANLTSFGYILATVKVRTTSTTLERVVNKIVAELNVAGYSVSIAKYELPDGNVFYKRWSYKETDDDGNSTLDTMDFVTLRKKVYEIRQQGATAYEIRKWCRVNELNAFLPTIKTYLDNCESTDNDNRKDALTAYFDNGGKRYTIVICPNETKSSKALYGDGNGRLGKTRLAKTMAQYISPDDNNAYHHYTVRINENGEKLDPLSCYQSQPTLIIDEWTGGNMDESRFTDLFSDTDCGFSQSRNVNKANVSLLNCLCGKNPWQSLFDDLLKVFGSNSINQATGRIAMVVKVDGEYATPYTIKDYDTGELSLCGNSFPWCPKDWNEGKTRPVITSDDIPLLGDIRKALRNAYQG